MSTERRFDLIEWAHDNNCVIVENDYEHEVNNFEEFIPSIYSLDTYQRTFFLGTFNRLLHPSIRIGYMVVPTYYLEAIEALLRHLHRFVPNSKQHVLSEFIEKNYIYSHIKNLIEVADERKDFFSKNFDHYFNGTLTINNSTTKSLHILANMPNNFSDVQLINELKTQNIVAHAYSKTFCGPKKENGLIMGYAPVNKKEMKQKLIKMHKVFLNSKSRI